MFSQIVTAAKGLFSRQESDDASLEKTHATSGASSRTASANTRKMVTATRQRKFTAEQPSTEPNANGSIETSGKRKSKPVSSEPTEMQNNKRRKRASLEAAPETEGNPSSKKSKTTEDNETEQQESSAPSSKTNHFRFGSEEPELPEVAATEDTTETQQEVQDSEDESSDDEAPETIDNSAQLSKIRLEAKRQERAKQIEEQLKRDKRKQLDDLRKSQAKLSKKKDADLLSESTETLQGTTTQDARRSALPALLPDDILNAAPDVRPPTPPAEERSMMHTKPNKLRFLDKKEKLPKDVRMGDVTIRVLDDTVSKKHNRPALPPKASKTGRNAKQNWLNKSRSTGSLNGLRRTAGTSSGFVRK
ncbi:hypothetical protein BO70DRAFT_342631 [Aspergillus heteromorphus CBS 117.55]|uniref:Immediate-early protein n=1 Tax=Aspergillus heteromorphus CBS 117.55 TaxID=1448321 RepID=A0A317VBB2_9EURO|nr:uncharacterized protein BO70DRAFT_342631 [Aspergillus heteromorphus CBS 117.55]PWY71644.1 hypothetical protein BO70DRAFT_342631 [Aspergillus heteromorphus CBS 117.55]